MRHSYRYSLILALLVGGIAAWYGVPLWKTERALRAITASEKSKRDSAWRTLSIQLARRDAYSIEQLLDKIGPALEMAPDDALLEASHYLHKLDRWNWDDLPTTLIIRDITMHLASGSEADHAHAVRLLKDCPLDLHQDQVMPLFDRILDSPFQSIRLEGFDAACGWLGLERIEWLADIRWPVTDQDLWRRYLLVMGWGPAVKIDLPEVLREQVSILEADLLRLARTSPNVLDQLESLRDVRLAGTYIAGQCDTAESILFLDTLSREGDEQATNIISTQVLDEATQMIASDEAFEPWRRRRAAWRWAAIDESSLQSILELDPVEPNGSVYATALLAEHYLSRDEASDLARSWITDFNDDRKRAGALLAALLGDHRQLLGEAFESEDVARVRTALRLAIWALGRKAGEEDAEEFAYRTLRNEDGDFDPDSVICMLLTGSKTSFELLTSPPPGGDWAAIQQREWLIERFIPEWHER
ncbi:MAG: hypothetical protein O7G85_07375, partial [Planctomycetota bacterium]|nr:hypothetical protein [Planctomycetota bacterium]